MGVDPSKSTWVDLGTSSGIGSVSLGTVDPPSNVELKRDFTVSPLKNGFCLCRLHRPLKYRTAVSHARVPELGSNWCFNVTSTSVARSLTNSVHITVHVHAGASIPSETMMHFPHVSDFPPIFDKFSDSEENFQNFTFSRKISSFSSAEISDDLF